MKNARKIELASVIAEKIIENQMGVHMVWKDREGGSGGLTKDAQGLFDEIYDIVSGILSDKAFSQ